MKFIIPVLLLLSSCATKDTNSNKVVSNNPEECPLINPMVFITPGKISEKKYRDNYFLFKFDIGTLGEVENLILLDSDSDEYMKKQAKRAMAKWRFMPLEINGKMIKQFNCEYKYIHKNI